MIRPACLLVPLALAACSAPAPTTPSSGPNATPSPPVAQAAPAPAARSYTLRLPDRWTREDKPSHETLVGPEGLVRIHVIETSEPDLAAAIAAGWKTASPSMQLKERQRATGSASERFAEELVITYTDDENEQLAQGIALRHAKRDDRVYLLLIEGPIKTVQKRAAELNRILSSLEVEGVSRLVVQADDRKAFDEGRQRALFDFVDAARKEAGVPGVALAVVTPEGVFTRGFGERRVGQTRPVDADTQFMIGSITKSFSTLLLATLVDEGKLSWDAKVKDVYPSFALGDARGDTLQIRHLFCACVGAPRQDMELLFEFAGKKPKDVFTEIAAMKLTTAIGETFQYNNQLTAAGGYVAGHVFAPNERDLGRAFDSALRRRVLERIGMKDSTLEEGRVVARGNHAMPHHLSWNGETKLLELKLERFVQPYAPAGALWSTANDMAKYLQLQLARGQAGPERVVSEENLKITQTPQIAVSDKTGYGMGWLIGEYRGLVAIEHSGGTMGFNSDLVFFPEIGVGLFVVANRSPAAMHGAVRSRLFELLFDLPDQAQGKHSHQLAELKRLTEEQAKKVADAAVPAAWLGRYQSAELGPMTIERRGDAVEVDVGEWRAGLAVLDPAERKDTFIITSGVLQGLLLHQQEIEGKPALVLKHSQSDYVFTKR